jgi:hypothetical protein
MVEEKGTHRHGPENDKHLKNPYHVHNGGHEWDDCHKNPKYQKGKKGNHNNNNNIRDMRDTNDNRDRCGNGQWNNNQSGQEEFRNAESRNHERDHSCQHSRTSHHQRNDSNDELKNLKEPLLLRLSLPFEEIKGLIINLPWIGGHWNFELLNQQRHHRVLFF